MKLSRLQRSTAFVAVSIAVLVSSLVLIALRHKTLTRVAYTVGDVHVMHAQVALGNREVRGHARLIDGDRVVTSSDGRAQVRLDDGTLVIVDGATSFTLRGSGVTLNHGRLFVQADSASRLQISMGTSSTSVSASTAAFDARELNKGNRWVYCARGELVVNVAGRRARVSSGETATIASEGLEIAPEKAFDDWTGGLAVPWAEGARSAIAEMWGGRGGDDPGTPLVIRAQNVDTSIDGELAVTKTRTRFFNGSESSVRGDVRLAIPSGAIVSRVALRTAAADSSEREATLLPSNLESRSGYLTAQLNWAGDGWLRGTLPDVAAGATVDLSVEYVEWLATQSDATLYRFPMAHAGQAPVVGDLSVKVDADRTDTPWMAASQGSVVRDRIVELHRADARPNGDLVVQLAPAVVKPNSARAYVAPGEKGEDSYVLIRTEVPDEAGTGVVLALVVDTSMSAGAASLETERAVVDALLDGLGSRDKVIVLAADQTVRPVGPPVPAAVTPALRMQLGRELAALHAGGASNIALALEQAADTLDAAGANGTSSMVVYIGDGRPTVAELEARDIRARLQRRSGGAPRLGAVAVGEGANRWLLARLVAGSGPIYEVADRTQAARAGAAVVADALEPTLRGVDFDLGSSIDRIYPREARAALAGSTVSIIGRLRGPLPRSIAFRFRDGNRRVEQMRPLVAIPLPAGADVARRWATARIEEMSARGEGFEVARALAAQSKLLTPFTSWFFVSPNDTTTHSSPPLAERLLGLSPTLDAAFAPYIEPASPSPAQLLEPPLAPAAGVSLAEGAQAAARRAIAESMPAFRACRDARAAVRATVTGSLRVAITIDPEGKGSDVRVTAKGSGEDDPALDRCVKGVIENLPFLGVGRPIRFVQTLTLPARRTSQRTQCSPAAALPLPVRRGIWRARGDHGADKYVLAARSCELPAWPDRRALLEICLGETKNGDERLSLASALDEAGETDAAAFVRNEALRRVATTEELMRVSRALIQGEPEIDGAFDKAFRAAQSDEKRLQVVERYLRIAPHSPLVRRHQLAVLESLGRKESLIAAIGGVRSDPFADAGLLATGASALRRVGQDVEGRRAFGELVERAPGDPWALAFAGDRLRAENLFDEAAADYENLSRALPNDPSVSLRLALAHAGAGRLDVATRLLERVTQNGGRGDDGRLGELASMTQAILLAGARGVSVGPELDAQLLRRLVQTPLPDVKSILLVSTPPEQNAVSISVMRERAERDPRPADLDAPALGLAAIRFERGDGPARIRLSRAPEPDAGRAVSATLSALVLAEDRANSKLVTRRVDVAANGAVIELRWNGESFL